MKLTLNEFEKVMFRTERLPICCQCYRPEEWEGAPFIMLFRDHLCCRCGERADQWVFRTRTNEEIEELKARADEEMAKRKQKPVVDADDEGKNDEGHDEFVKYLWRRVDECFGTPERAEETNRRMKETLQRIIQERQNESHTQSIGHD